MCPKRLENLCTQMGPKWTETFRVFCILLVNYGIKRNGQYNK